MAHQTRLGISFYLLITTFCFFASALAAAASQTNNRPQPDLQSSADFGVLEKRDRQPVPSLEELGCTVEQSSRRGYYKVTHETNEKLDFYMEAKADDKTQTLTLYSVRKGNPSPFETRKAFLAFWQHATNKGADDLLSFTYLGVDNPDTIGAIGEVQDSMNPKCTDDGMCTVTFEEPRPFYFLMDEAPHADIVSSIPYEFEGFERHFVESFDWSDTRKTQKWNFWFRINFELDK
ncbi:hypothetical protein QIS74_11400 [Colletotrichum tabaci]|uniref:Uncharacterized protein n=1 Tax=Colletotrichum tabaci TaxID=1209068 RepID=A0AAV9SYB6_9PEZI